MWPRDVLAFVPRYSSAIPLSRIFPRFSRSTRRPQDVDIFVVASSSLVAIAFGGGWERIVPPSFFLALHAVDEFLDALGAKTQTFSELDAWYCWPPRTVRM